MTLPEAIRRHFGLSLVGLDALTAGKGQAVYGVGRVQWVKDDRDKDDSVNDGSDRTVLKAAVSGSHGETYRTSISLTRTFDNLRMTSGCTCPVTGQCKHAVAALIAWLAAQDDADAGGGGSSHGDGDAARQRSRALFRRQHALHWARELNSVKIAGGRREADQAHLYYVLQVQERAARLSVFRIRRLKGGDLARPERYLALSDHALHPPPSWDDVDASVALSMLHEERSSSAGYLLAGPRARDALLQLADAGRLYLDAPPTHAHDPALQRGPELPARLAWQAVPADHPRIEREEAEPSPPLRLGLEAPPSALPIYCAAPCYVDRVAGTLGALALDQPISSSLMQWLRDAPPVPADAAPEVAMALHATYLAKPALLGRIPDLPKQQVREVSAPPRFVLGLFTTGATLPRPGQRQFARRPFMAVSLAVEYAGQRTAPLRLATMGIQSDEGPLLVVCDRAAEHAALTMLRESVSGIARDEPGLSLAPLPGAGHGSGASSGWLTVAAVPADGIAAARIKHELAARLEASGWITVDQSDLPTSLVSANNIVAELQPQAPGGTTRDWFQLQSGIEVGDRRVDLAPLLASIVAMGGFDTWKNARCPDGVLWMKISDSEVLQLDTRRIEPLARVVADWAQLAGEADDDENSEAPALLVNPFAAAQLAGTVSEIALPEPVRKLRDWFESFQGLQRVPAPDSFLAELRPYQQEGLAWLQFLSGAGLGGILADDMGLGKTIQVLAHLELERSAGRLANPALVVAPTSVIFNWQAEARRHAPGLRLLALTGLGRSKRFAEIGGHDLVLTSYALLPRDATVLRAQQWHAVILDEAQLIKNHRTIGSTVVRQLSSNHRLALTGTPLENHLGELWSIMDFVLPGLLGSDDAFRNRFRAPIEKHPGSDTASERLRALESRIRPFMLRRTKEAVLADLPPRTEIIQRIELPTEQRDLYESIRAAMDKRVREALSQAGLAKSQIVLLDALLKLRQACCDPALVKLPGARKVSRSAKRDALIELLATLVDEGRKALVFSQFTSMLDLIETALDADPRLAKVPRARLDGSTSDRGEVVEQFQQGDAQLFLLSLKAGGVGLNLTAADTVIHYDPWWNPAVENQATDRAHRIGQERPVFVHKLIAAGTVEERILALQARKAELAAAVLSGSLSAGGKALTQEDLLGLFEPL